MQTNTSDNKINTAIPHHHGMELNQMNATQINTLMEKHFDSLSKEEISLATELLDDPQVPSLENFKSQARLLQHLSGNHIKLSHALDILSQEYGKRDWRTLKTTLGSGNIAEVLEQTVFYLERYFLLYTPGEKKIQGRE